VEKIIVRKKILKRGEINSTYIDLCDDAEYDTVEEFLWDYNHKTALYEIYGEELDCEQLEKLIPL